MVHRFLNDTKQYWGSVPMKENEHKFKVIRFDHHRPTIVLILATDEQLV